MNAISFSIHRLSPTTLLLGTALLSACGTQAAPTHEMPPPPAVSVAEVVVKPVQHWDEFTGRIEAVESVQLRPRVSGYIEKLHYQEGSEVTKGEVLFSIDARPYRAELARAEAELARAKAQAAQARTEAARADQLAKARAISSEERDQRIANDAAAKAAVMAAEAAVEMARLNLSYTQVRAPIDGRTGRAMVTEGNLVNAGESVLTTVVSLDPVYAYFEGDEGIYLAYKQMARDGARPSSREVRNPVYVGLSNETGYPHRGTMDFVDNQVNPETGTIRGRALLDNSQRIFTPGLFARVKLVGSSHYEALLIDDKAVLTDQDRRYVYVLGSDNQAQRRDVKLGRQVDGLRIVETGLQAGDQVIVHGVQKVFFPGMAVQPNPIAMGEPPASGPQQTAAGEHGGHS